MTIQETVVERTSTVIAAGAATSRLWLPSLDQVSVLAAQWLPILGCIWLLTQMTAWGVKQWRKRSPP